MEAGHGPGKSCKGRGVSRHRGEGRRPKEVDAYLESLGRLMSEREPGPSVFFPVSLCDQRAPDNVHL